MQVPGNESPRPENHGAAEGAPPLQKPKRKYAVSEKSRAASRRNLVLANLAPHWLKYRCTDRRRAQCYKALEKAVAELRRFDSPHYGLGFKRGTSCASLIRSLALAGEKKEDYEEHLQLMQEALAPVDDDGRKNARAAAEAVWRRLRVHRGRARWELFAVASVLAEVIAERAEEADPAKAMGPMTPDRAVMLGLQIVTLLLDKKPQQEARHLNLRIERLLRGMMEVDEALGFILEAKPRPEEKEYRQRTAEQLGNPLRSAAQIVNALREKQGEKIKGTGDWQGWGEGSEKNRAGCLGADERAQRGGMIRDLLQRKVAGVDLELLEGAEGKAAWMELWLRAFGIADEIGNSKSEAGKSKAGDRVSSFDSRVSRVEVLAFAEMVWERIAMFRRQGEKERADVREALETAVLAKRAAAEEIADSELPVEDCPEDETRNSKFETRPPDADSSCESPDSGSEQSSIGNQQSSISWSLRDVGVMLLAPLTVIKCTRAQLEAYRDLNGRYYQLLVKLYGPSARFETFLRESKESATDVGSRIIRALLGSHIRAKGGKVGEEIEWRGGFGGRKPGGGP